MMQVMISAPCTALFTTEATAVGDIELDVSSVAGNVIFIHLLFYYRIL